MSSGPLPTPSIVVRQNRRGEPIYFAKWRSEKQVSKTVGPAWLTPDGAGGWVKRRGRTPNGFYDERTVHIAAAELVARVEAERAAATAAVEAAPPVAVLPLRKLADEWLHHLEHVAGATDNTMRNYRSMLADHGVPWKNGRGLTAGPIMKRFRDRESTEITPKEFSAFLTELDGEGRAPRNVNHYRQVLHSIYEYAGRADTYGIQPNPLSGVPRRREPAVARLDFYEHHEVQALARAAEAGAHRTARGRASEGHVGPVLPAPLSRAQKAAQVSEAEARRAEDHQDADFYRVLFFSALRLSELLTLQIEQVRFLRDMDGAIVRLNAEDVKFHKHRDVPLPRPAAEALARVLARRDFTQPADYVFCNRYGRKLDGSSLRKRYKRACAAAGLRPIKLHGLRHAAGSIMARTMPLPDVRDIMGHSKLQTTERYLHSKIDDRAVKAVNAAFGVDDGRAADVPAEDPL